MKQQRIMEWNSRQCEEAVRLKKFCCFFVVKRTFQKPDPLYIMRGG